jgi:hypothetical protein
MLKENLDDERYDYERGRLPKPSLNPKPKELFLEMTFHSVVGFVQFMPLIYFIKQYSLCGFSW